jgi:hypothetical protein
VAAARGALNAGIAKRSAKPIGYIHMPPLGESVWPV